MDRNLRRALIPTSFGALAAMLVLAARALAGPAPFPGGHLPISYGGDNTPGYPPLSATGIATPGENAVPGIAVTVAPNPFRSSTAIRFPLEANETGTIRIYTAAGRLVREVPVAGTGASFREFVWDGRDGGGKALPSGLYFYRVQAGFRTAVGRVVLAR